MLVVSFTRSTSGGECGRDDVVSSWSSDEAFMPGEVSSLFFVDSVLTGGWRGRVAIGRGLIP